MENITRIMENLRKGLYTSNPHECAEDLAVLAGEYSYIMGEWEQILQRKAATWNILRTQLKSDNSADKAWESTPDGIKESSLRLRAKGAEKMMSALKSLIRIAEAESQNLM